MIQSGELGGSALLAPTESAGFEHLEYNYLKKNYVSHLSSVINLSSALLLLFCPFLAEPSSGQAAE